MITAIIQITITDIGMTERTMMTKQAITTTEAESKMTELHPTMTEDTTKEEDPHHKDILHPNKRPQTDHNPLESEALDLKLPPLAITQSAKR
jgi:hypothetical protein